MGRMSSLQWLTPLPFDDKLPPVDPFDKKLLPECLRCWVMDTAERMQVPMDFPAAALVAALGMTASGALKKVVLDTLDQLGWKPDEGLSKESREIEYTDTVNVLGEGGEGRFGKSGDFAQPAKAPKIER